MPEPDGPGRPLPAASPIRAGWAYRGAAAVAFGIMRLQGWRFDVAGLGHVPRTGGVVLVANHASYWDFFTVGRPVDRELGRPVRILAKASLFRVPGFGRLMSRAGHVPVDRGRGAAALEGAIGALQRGEVVLVLPERTISRSFDLLPFKTGAVRLAARAGVPLVPAVSWGSHRFHTVGRGPRPVLRLPVSIRYGEPSWPAPADDPVATTEVLRARVAALLDDAIATYPDGAPAGAWWVPRRLGGGAPPHSEAIAEVERLAARWRTPAGRRPGHRSGDDER